MAQTITTSAPQARTNVSTGRYLDTGTVAAYDFNLGFKPRYVKIQNVTDRTQIEWFEGMADASGVVTVAAGTRTLVVANGITPTTRGFTFGLDTNVNVTNKQISFVAIA